MPERLSRHERMQLRTPSTTSIFDLAKVAQARTKSIDEGFLNAGKNPRHYIDVLSIGSYVPSSPSTSDFSEAEEAWYSDIGEDLREEDEIRQREAHRAAALAALEGRAAPVTNPEPIFRCARMEYDDNVEAEHGQLHTFQPRPRRAPSSFQKSITLWEDYVSANEAQVLEEPALDLTMMVSNRSADSFGWLDSESPVDLLRGRPVFYSQSKAEQTEQFWSEMTLDELNAIA